MNLQIVPTFISHGFILFAQASIEAQVDNFLAFLGKLLLLVAVIMVIWAGLLLHDGKTREGVFALTGAFVLSIAVPAAKAIFSLSGTGVGP